MNATTELAKNIITEKVAELIAETIGNKNYNAFNLASDALKIAREVIANIPGVEFIPGEPNSKTGIKSIDLLPLVTCACVARETCGKINSGCKYNKGRCYALKLLYRNPATCARYAINTALAIDKPAAFWEGVNSLLYCERFVRLFVAGDANLPGFAEKLVEVVEKNPHCKVQGFTKCYDKFNAIIEKRGSLPENLVLLFSGWEELKPTNPHNLPISDVYDENLPEGWLSCGGNCLECACVGLGCWKAQKGDVVGLKRH